MPNQIPDYCEPLTAWRFWRVSTGPLDDGPLQLASSMGKIRWLPHQPVKAVHDQSRFRLSSTPCCDDSPCEAWSPGMGGAYGCGLYGYKTADQLRQYLKTWARVGNPLYVVGQVFLWGRIIEHQYGYRAQYAYPKCLVYVANEIAHTAIGRDMATLYGIPYEEDTSWKLENLRESLSLNLWSSPASYRFFLP